jgi:hypothetical protein
MTIIHRLLFQHINTLEVDYIGARCAKIRFLGKCRIYHLERIMLPLCNSCGGYRFNFIKDFNCNGIETIATITLLPTSVKTFSEYLKK